MSTELVANQQSPPKDEEAPLENIALEFFRMMHAKKHPRQETKSPGLPPRAAVGHIQTDSGGGTPVTGGAVGEADRAARVSVGCFSFRFYFTHFNRVLVCAMTCLLHVAFLPVHCSWGGILIVLWTQLPLCFSKLCLHCS